MAVLPQHLWTSSTSVHSLLYSSCVHWPGAQIYYACPTFPLLEPKNFVTSGDCDSELTVQYSGSYRHPVPIACIPEVIQWHLLHVGQLGDLVLLLDRHHPTEQQEILERGCFNPFVVNNFICNGEGSTGHVDCCFKANKHLSYVTSWHRVVGWNFEV